jgi:hypothetical protein
MFAGLDRRGRVTGDAGKAARERWMMRFDQKLVLVMIEPPPKEMPHRELAPHGEHQMLGDLADCGMLVTPGAGKASRGFDIDRGAFMFAMTSKAFEASDRADDQSSTREQANVGVTHVQTAMTILVPEGAVATDAPVVRRSAPWTMAGHAIAGELAMGRQQGAWLVV